MAVTENIITQVKRDIKIIASIKESVRLTAARVNGDVVLLGVRNSSYCAGFRDAISKIEQGILDELDKQTEKAYREMRP